jgi:hypothetical protein
LSNEAEPELSRGGRIEFDRTKVVFNLLFEARDFGTAALGFQNSAIVELFGGSETTPKFDFVLFELGLQFFAFVQCCFVWESDLAEGFQLGAGGIHL